MVAEPALGAEPLKADEEQPRRGQHRMKCTADLLDALMLTDIPVQTGPWFSTDSQDCKGKVFSLCS